jgi:hypothetical protein
MAGTIISLLWFLIYAVVLCGVIWLVLYGLKTVAGIPIPDRLEKGLWFVVMILLLIYLITALVGGGSIPHPNMRF